MELYEIGVYLGVGLMIAILFFLFEWFYRMMNEDDKLGVEPAAPLEAPLVACGESGEHNDDADE
jgi:hypothetical protein